MKRQIISTLLKAHRPDLANAVAHTVTAGRKLDAKTRQQANRDLIKAGLDGNGRFKRIGEALNAIARVLERHGIEQDDVFSADRFRAPKGHQTFAIAFSNRDDPFSPETVDNSMLVIQWYRYDGRLGEDLFEVLAYLS